MHLRFERLTLGVIAFTPLVICVFLVFMLAPDLGAATKPLYQPSRRQGQSISSLSLRERVRVRVLSDVTRYITQLVEKAQHPTATPGKRPWWLWGVCVLVTLVGVGLCFRVGFESAFGGPGMICHACGPSLTLP